MVNGAGRGHLHGLQAGRELHPHQDIREGRHQLQRSPGNRGTCQCCTGPDPAMFWICLDWIRIQLGLLILIQEGNNVTQKKDKLKIE
jgi:hypothetical protein